MTIGKITNNQLKAELEAGMTNKAIAEKYEMSIRKVELRRSKLAKSGVGYGSDVSKLIPEGYAVKGVSTLLVSEGEVKGQWVESDIDKEAQTKIMQAAVDALCDEMPVYKEVDLKVTKQDENLLRLYTITDAHIGMMACTEETGSNYDTKIAEQLISDWLRSAVEMSPKSKDCIINKQGDWMHFDSFKAVTPTSGHLLDADTRFFRLFKLQLEQLDLLLISV
jgi:DNA-binding Lrp family transcriptional regulator